MTIDKIRKIIATECGINIEQVSVDSSMDSIDEWDSIKQMDIVLAVEATFGVELSDMDVVELTSVALLAAFIDND